MFSYIRGYLAAETRELRDEASRSARAWLVSKGYGSGGHWTDAYRIQFASYTRAFINERLHAAGLEASRKDKSKAK